MATFRVNLYVATKEDQNAPAARKRKQPKSILADPLVLLAAALSIGVAGAAVWLDRDTTNRRQVLLEEVRSAMESNEALNENVMLANDFRLRSTQIDSQMAVLKTIDGGRYIWAYVMNQVALSVPPDLWLTEWKETGAADAAGGPQIKFEIQGYAATQDLLNTFIQNLEASPFLSEVEFTRNMTEKVSEQEVVAFTIVGRTVEPESQFLEWETIGVGAQAAPAPARPASDSASSAPAQNHAQ